MRNMTVAARKQREKEEMRQLILNAARAIFLEKGYEQTSIRNIAEKIEYSPGTISVSSLPLTTSTRAGRVC